MTLALRYMVIEKRNFHGSMEMSFFAWNMEMFFLCYALIHAQKWP